jgi:hypothetical protein
MASDPKAKPPPPEIIVEGDWPLFLRHPTDPYERARRAQQTADEQRERAQQTADEQRESERKQRARLHTANGRERKAAKRRREVETFMKVAETVTVRKTPWRVAGAALPQVNKLRKLDRDFCFDELKTCDPIYRVVRIPRNWSRLTSLR